MRFAQELQYYNTSRYKFWSEAILPFLKGEQTLLDLSNEPYSIVTKDAIVEKEIRPWQTLYSHEKETNGRIATQQDARTEFIRMLSQTKLDEIFGIFPLIAFSKGHPLNVSVDQIQPDIKGSGYQLINVMLKSKSDSKRGRPNLKRRKQFQVAIPTRGVYAPPKSLQWLCRCNRTS